MFKKRRLAQKQFEERLKKINPDITVIGEYKETTQRVKVRCNKCGHEWSPIASSLLYMKSGCPACHFKELHKQCRQKNSPSRKKFVELLSKKFPNIELISEYTSLSHPITLRCKDCGHTWTRNAGLVIRSHGCPKCAHVTSAKNRFFNKKAVFVERMAKINPDITILGEYQGSAPKILVRCNVCGKEWMASPNNLLRGRGCPDCYKHNIKGRKLSIKKLRNNFEEKLAKINPGVSVISNYKSSTDKIVVRCNDCGCEYITTPSQLLHGGGRCPACKISSSGRKSKIVHGPIYFGGPSEAEYFVQTVNRLDDEQK